MSFLLVPVRAFIAVTRKHQGTRKDTPNRKSENIKQSRLLKQNSINEVEVTTILKKNSNGFTKDLSGVS